MKPQHYVHAFTCGAICSFTMDPAKPGAMVNCRWSRPIAPHERAQVLREYLAWKADLMQAEANRTGKTILDLVEVSRGHWLPCSYTPQSAGTPSGTSPGKQETSNAGHPAESDQT